MKEFVRWRERTEGTGVDAGRIFAVILAVTGVAAAALFFVRRALYARVVNEDAFISFRYARNLLAGDGLVFNPGGERVEGITNLLWTLFLAGASWASGTSLPQLSVALGVLCGTLTVFLAFLWCYREVRDASVSAPRAVVTALAAPMLLALAPGFAFYSASGLEVALFALLLTGGLFLLARGNSVAALVVGSVALGLATMTRPEGALALAFGVAACAVIPAGASPGTRLKRIFAAGLPGAGVVLLFTIWRLLYYGAVLPNTAHAKAGGMEVVENWGIPYLLGAAQGNWFLIAWLVAIGGAALDRGFRVRALAGLAITPVWCVYLLYVGGDYMAFHRLVVPLLPVLFVLSVSGFVHIAGALGTGNPSPARRAVLIGVLAVALAFPLLVGLPQQFEKEKAKQLDWREDNRGRMEAAEWFRENDPDALVARNGVGVLGFYTDVRIIDMLGLNDEHIARHGEKHPKALPGHQASDASYVLSREPDYIMIGRGPEYRFPGDRKLGQSQRFNEEYEFVRVELDNGQKLSMYRREEGT